MNPQVKNYLGWALIVMVIVFALSALKLAWAFDRTSQRSASSSFTVSGEGKAVGIPDIARLSIGVITEGGTDLVKLQKDNTDKVNKIIAFAKEKGVESKDVRTEQYSVSPRYEYSNCRTSSVCPPPRIVGYSISQSIEVKVRDFSVTGEILSGAVTAGANTVSGPSFELDDPSSLVTEARAEALQKARASAEATAKAGGFRLGRIISIDEGYTPVYRETLQYAKAADLAVQNMAAPAPSIEAGSQDIRMTLTVRYEIQ